MPHAPAPTDRAGARPLLNGLFREVDASSLAFFRIAFGVVMFWHCWIHLAYGLVPKFWIQPRFRFAYNFLEWLAPWPGEGMFVHFYVMSLLAVLVALGLFYRVSMALFFLAFSYVLLLEETYYQNHYYLIALVSFVLIFVPCHRRWSLDARLFRSCRSETLPFWGLFLVRFMVGVPYFFGGIAKLNADWLLRAEPIGSWLLARRELPLVEFLLGVEELERPIAFGFAYSGMLLDLLAVPLLCWSRSRPWFMLAIILFHVLNSTIFDIGIFPWFMVLATTVFFAADWPRRLGRDLFVAPQARAVRGLLVGALVAYLVTTLRGRTMLVPYLASAVAGCLVWWSLEERCQRLRVRSLGWLAAAFRPVERPPAPPAPQRLTGRQWAVVAAIALWLVPQLLVPLRHYLIPGNASWTEEGRRFAWHMKLRDKKVWALFYRMDPATGRLVALDVKELLEPWQIRKMSMRPFMIRQFAHHLSERLRVRGFEDDRVFVRARVRLNGRPWADLIDTRVDLSSQPPSLWKADWILPLDAPQGTLAEIEAITAEPPSARR